MRLAEHVHHTTDVDGMLDSMSPAQFDEWAAKDLVEPVGYQSQMMGYVAYLLHAWIAGADSTLEPHDFMPWVSKAEEPKTNNAAAKQLLGSMLGR